MAYRYVQEVAPLFSSGLCRPRAFDASQRSLAALAQALVEARPVWPVCEPSVEQLHHRTARRPIFAHPRSGWIGQAFRELDDHLSSLCLREGCDPEAASASPLRMAVDVKEDAKAVTFVADVPGLKQENLKVHLTKHKVLTISGERNSESNETSADGFNRVERQSGSIVRKFQLPDNIDVQNIQAKLQDGVLTLTVPKTATDEPTDQQIKIHAAAEETHHGTHTAAAEKLQSKSQETKVEKSDERPGMGCPVEWPPRITVSYNANPKRHREANATESAAPSTSAVAAAPPATS